MMLMMTHQEKNKFKNFVNHFRVRILKVLKENSTFIPFLSLLLFISFIYIILHRSLSTHLPFIGSNNYRSCVGVWIYDGATENISTVEFCVRFTMLHDCPLTSKKTLPDAFTCMQGGPREREAGPKVVRPVIGFKRLSWGGYHL